MKKRPRWEGHEEFIWELVENEYVPIEIEREFLETFDVKGSDDYKDIWLQTLEIMKEKRLTKAELYIEEDKWNDVYIHLLRPRRSRPNQFDDEGGWEHVRLKTWDKYNIEAEDKLVLLRMLMGAKTIPREERVEWL